MKLSAILIVAIFSVLLLACVRNQDNFFQKNNQEKIIALQPLGDYNVQQLSFISEVITSFFNKKVIILKPLNLPGTFHVATQVEIYVADSILDLLPRILSDQIVEVVALTHEDIVTLNKGKSKTKKIETSNNLLPVFGLADFMGNCAVISDFRLRSPDTTIFNRRLKAVVIHEMGHNIGLDHCNSANCIMSSLNGNLIVLDKCEEDYCLQCRKQLKKINPAYPWLKDLFY